MGFEELVLAIDVSFVMPAGKLHDQIAKGLYSWIIFSVRLAIGTLIYIYNV